MKSKANTFKILALGEILLIFSLVPIARTIQEFFRNLVTQLGISFTVIGWSIVGGVILLCIFYYSTLKTIKFKYLSLHLTATVTLGAIIIYHIGSILIEYTHIITYGVLYFLLRLSFSKPLQRSYTEGQLKCSITQKLKNIILRHFRRRFRIRKQKIYPPPPANQGSIIGHFHWRGVYLPLQCILIATGVSFVDEILQGLHPDRFFDVRDLLLNLLGTMVGALLFEPLYTKTHQKQPSAHAPKKTSCAGQK